MEKVYNNATTFLMESKLHPVVKLLTYCQNELILAKSIKGDVEEGKVTIVCPTWLAFRLADRIWQVFVYCGRSFDKLIIDPRYKTNSNIAKVNYVALHLSVKNDQKENRLNIYFKRIENYEPEQKQSETAAETTGSKTE